MRASDVGTFVATSPATQTYLTGFLARNYSRPVLLVVDLGRTRLVVPALEEANAAGLAAVDEVIAYGEIDGDAYAFRTAAACLDALLSRAGQRASVGLEFQHCDLLLGEVVRNRAARLVDLGPAVLELRAVKDDVELSVLSRAASLVELGVRASLDACRPGATEIEVDAAGYRAVLEAAVEGRDLAVLEQLMMSPSGVSRTCLPHTFSTNRRIQPGDAVIHTRHVGIDGYRAELERTVFTGLDSQQRRVFEVMLAAREAAITMLREGTPCRDIDRAARGPIERAGLGRFLRHRTGHGIGLTTHEPPYLRSDNNEPLVAGMVVTIEPGIYVPGVGGFRHSDTFVVEPSGARRLTRFPGALADALVTGA